MTYAAVGWDREDRNDLIDAINRLAQAQEVNNLISGSVAAQHYGDERLASDLWERAMLFVDPPTEPKVPASVHCPSCDALAVSFADGSVLCSACGRVLGP